MEILLGDDTVRRCLDDAAQSPMANPEEAYPRWYLRRWHFLPEGYLSHRSVDLYQRLIPRLYYVGQESRVMSAFIRRVVVPRAPKRVLDLGCGDGSLIAGIAEALPEARVTGVDLSPFLLERAAERTAASGGRVDLVHRNMAEMEIEPGSADLIVASHVLGHIPAAPASEVFRRALASLREGGRLATIEHAWHPLPGNAVPLRTWSMAGGILKVRVWRPAIG